VPTRILLIIPLIYSISIPLSEIVLLRWVNIEYFLWNHFSTVVFFIYFLIGLGFTFNILKSRYIFVFSLAVSIFQCFTGISSYKEI
jgi:hypothetical protein